jgi:hypothetical protein
VSEPKECAIEAAVYQNTAAGLEPQLFCECGFVTDGADTWAETGEQMDEHLEETGGRRPGTA